MDNDYQFYSIVIEKYISERIEILKEIAYTPIKAKYTKIEKYIYFLR